MSLETGELGSVSRAPRLGAVKSVGPNQFDHRLHAAGLVEVACVAFEVLHASRGAQQGHQVATGGGAPDADVIGVEVVLLGVGPQPADGRFAIFDLGGEHGVLAQAVVDAGRGVALAYQRYGGATVLVAVLPASAVNPDHQRQGMLGGLLRQVEVEFLQFMSAGDVGQVFEYLDARRRALFFRPLRRLGRLRSLPTQQDRQSHRPNRVSSHG